MYLISLVKIKRHIKLYLSAYVSHKNNDMKLKIVHVKREDDIIN